MKLLVHNPDVRVSKAVSDVIDKKVEKIKTRLKRYHPDVADLEVRLNKLESGNEFECNLVLKAFKETLNAKKSGPDLRIAVDRSFDAMLRELDHYRVKINKSLQTH